MNSMNTTLILETPTCKEDGENEPYNKDVGEHMPGNTFEMGPATPYCLVPG